MRVKVNIIYSMCYAFTDPNLFLKKKPEHSFVLIFAITLIGYLPKAKLLLSVQNQRNLTSPLMKELTKY